MRQFVAVVSVVLLSTCLPSGGHPFNSIILKREPATDCSDLSNYFIPCNNQITGLSKDSQSTDFNSCCTACCNDPHCNVCQFQSGSGQGNGCWRGSPRKWPQQCDSKSGAWQGMGRTKFSCDSSQGTCSADSNGQYDDKPSCQSDCHAPSPPPPPPSPPPPPPPPGPNPSPPSPPPSTAPPFLPHSKTAEPQKTIGTGTKILLVFFLALCIPYFVGGALFRKYRLHVDGRDVVPHVDFWGSLPGLIKEGCAYSGLLVTVWLRRSKDRFYERLS